MKINYLKQKLCAIIFHSLFFTSCEENINLIPTKNEISIENNANPNTFLEHTGLKGDLTNIKYNNTELLVQKIDNQYYFEGDIMLIPDSGIYNPLEKSAKINSTGRATKLWENNTIYYTIDESLNYTYRVYNAIEHWEQNTNIRFEEKTDTTTDYVTFISGTGCSSYVGKIGGQQFVTLQDECSTGNTIHEIGHVIGLWHEHSRKDRDNYLVINYENIEPGFEHNFKTYEERYLDGQEYTSYLDFESIMMYSPYSFSINNLPTITTIDGSTNYPYQREKLSDGDIEGINKMYPEIDTENEIGVIKNPSFSLNRAYKDNSSSTCSCYAWYNPNFPKQSGTSTNSNDYPGNEGGGSIKLNYPNNENQRVAYQLVNVLPNTTYSLSFYYAINEDTNLGKLDFRILKPEATDPYSITSTNTIIQFIGEATENTSSINGSKGGGQLVELEFTPTTDQIVLYATNSVLNGSDVRIDNFNLKPIAPEIKNSSFTLKRVYKSNSTSTCSCYEWYNINFPLQPATSTDSNDDSGNEGGGSIKLDYRDEESQRTAYQLINGFAPGTTYKISFYYAITNGNNPGKLDFRILKPSAENPTTVTSSNTIVQFIGEQTNNTWSIDTSKGGGGELVEVEFTPTTNQIALYAVNSVLNGSDVRIDNFSIKISN